METEAMSMMPRKYRFGVALGVFVAIWIVLLIVASIFLKGILRSFAMSGTPQETLNFMMTAGFVIKLILTFWIAKRITNAIMRQPGLGKPTDETMSAGGLVTAWKEATCELEPGAVHRETVSRNGYLADDDNRTVEMRLGPRIVVRHKPGGRVCGLLPIRHRRLNRGALHSAKRQTACIAEGSLFERRYRVLGILGEGGTGVVYRAVDTLLNMEVAIKLVSESLLNDPSSLQAFREEARIAMKLAHPNIVRIANLEKAGSRYFLVMEYIEGRSLREIIRGVGPLAAEDVWPVLDECCDALLHAHSNGIVHTDLKPENIIITGEGRPKIIDFCVARLMGHQKTEYVVGTPQYMSPEQIRGQQLDARTDVYALGVIFFEMLTGKDLFSESISVDAHRNPEGLTSAELSPRIESVVRKATAYDMAERYASVADFRAAMLGACATAVAGR